MGRKPTSQEENEPIKYFSEVTAAKKTERAVKKEEQAPDNLIKTLRLDLLPGSQVIPAEENKYRQINFRLILGLLIALMVLVLIWYSVAGAGRPFLEQRLSNFIPTASNTMQPAKTSPISAIDKLPLVSSSPSPTQSSTPTQTLIPTRTLRPSLTPTILRSATQSVSLPTHTQSSTPTPANACQEATKITLADVGKTLCVQGVVIETVEKSSSFMVIFSHEKGAFYWVTYDMVWSKAKPGECYQAEGTIRQIGNSPILIFNYDNIPEVCP